MAMTTPTAQYRASHRFNESRQVTRSNKGVVRDFMVPIAHMTALEVKP